MATEVEPIEGELQFGEFLVAEEVVDRYQLFRALQLQDRMGHKRIGECIAALGYAPLLAIERLFERFTKLQPLAA